MTIVYETAQWSWFLRLWLCSSLFNIRPVLNPDHTHIFIVVCWLSLVSSQLLRKSDAFPSQQESVCGSNAIPLEPSGLTHIHTHANIHLTTYQRLNLGGEWDWVWQSGWSSMSGRSQGLGLGGVCLGCKWRQTCCRLLCTAGCCLHHLPLTHLKTTWKPLPAGLPAARGWGCCHGNWGTWRRCLALQPSQQNSWSMWLKEGVRRGRNRGYMSLYRQIYLHCSVPVMEKDLATPSYRSGMCCKHILCISLQTFFVRKNK